MKIHSIGIKKVKVGWIRKSLIVLLFLPLVAISVILNLGVVILFYPVLVFRGIRIVISSAIENWNTP